MENRQNGGSRVKPIGQLLGREVTRKEFLGLLGGGVLVLTGFDRLIQLLTHHGQPIGASRTKGFRSGPYGGELRATRRTG